MTFKGREFHMNIFWRALAALLALTVAIPASAQIHVLDPFGTNQIHPFGSPQGAVSQLLVTSSDACQAPASGLSTVAWNGRKYKMANGRAWNTLTAYALCLGTNGSDYARFELHDTPYDHGPNDVSTKRRDELGYNANSHNDVAYWFAADFKLHVDGLKGSLGQTFYQWQDPKGSSPSAALRVVYCKTSPSFICLRATTRYDQGGGATVNRGDAPLSQDVVHNIVTRVQTGLNGSFDAYLDGRPFAHYAGPFGDTSLGASYGFRFGDYGAPLNGMTITYEYKHIVFPTTADQSGRIALAPAW